MVEYDFGESVISYVRRQGTVLCLLFLNFLTKETENRPNVIKFIAYNRTARQKLSIETADPWTEAQKMRA